MNSIRGTAMLTCALLAACTTDGGGGGLSSSAGTTTGAGGSGSASSTTSTAGSTGSTSSAGGSGGTSSTATSTTSTSGAGGSGSTTSTATGTSSTSGAGGSGGSSSTTSTTGGAATGGAATGGAATGGAATGGSGPACATSTCTTPSDCPAPASECVLRTCDMGCCGTQNEPDGKVTTGGQAAHDCRVVVCDGAGATKSLLDDSDLLDDGNECTMDACLAGSPTNLPAPAGAACTAGGKLCDGNGACVECLTTADCTGVDVCDPLGGTRTCVAATCADTVKSGFETDVDCGGPKCAPCADGKACLVATDCASNVCSGGLCLAPVCGDGIRTSNEACDDGNTTYGDGCSLTCTVEAGFTCTGTPSVCKTICGDGIRAGTEACDDGNAINSDGCTSTCAVLLGYKCTGSPSVCKTTCGDGIRAGNEACDDGNTTNGDGCSSTCTVQPGYTCTGSSPSVCTPISCPNTTTDVNNCGTCGHVCGGFWPMCIGGVCTSGTQLYPAPPTGQTWTDCSSGPTTQNGGDLLWVKRASLTCSNTYEQYPPAIGFGPAGEVAVQIVCQDIGSASTVAGSYNGFGAGLYGATATESIGGSVFHSWTPNMPSCGSPCVGASGTVVTLNEGSKFAEDRARLAISGPGVNTQISGLISAQDPGPPPIEGVNVDPVGNIFLLLTKATTSGPDTRLLRIDASGTSSLLGFSGLYTPDRTGGVLRFGTIFAGKDVGCGPMTPSGPSKSYLVRLDGSWGCVYSRELSLGPVSIQVDPNGGAVLSTTSVATRDLGCGPISPLPGGSTALTRLDPSGNCVFGRAMGAQFLSPIPTINETLLFGPAPAGSVDLGGGPLAPVGSNDLLLVKLDASGNHLWSKRIGYSGSAKVSISTAGDIYVLARYGGTVNFGGGPILAAAADVVVASYSPAGAHRWSRRYAFNTNYAAGIDACGSLVVTTANRNFDAGNGPVLPPGLLAPNQNVALVRYAP